MAEAAINAPCTYKCRAVLVAVGTALIKRLSSTGVQKEELEVGVVPKHNNSIARFVVFTVVSRHVATFQAH